MRGSDDGAQNGRDTGCPGRQMSRTQLHAAVSKIDFSVDSRSVELDLLE